MLIRYFAIEKEEDIYGESLICQTENTDIVPRKGEMVFLGTDSYRVNDVCNVIDYKSRQSNEVILAMIDIFVFKIKLSGDQI